MEIEADFEVDPSHEGSTGFRTVQFGNTSRRHRSGSDLEISLSDNVVRNTQKEKESAEGTIRSLLEKYVSTPNARRTLANRDTDRIIQSSETVENATDVVQALHSAVGENVVTRLVDVIREDPVIATEVIEQTLASIKSKTTPVQIESMESESSQRIDMDRLERHEIIEGDLKLEYYSYDSMKVLQRQMKITNRNDFCVGDPGEEGFETHPIMSNEFQEAFRCIKKEIENHSNESVFWLGPTSTRKSTVSFLQIYSDKTCTSLNHAGATFYPIHLNQLNYSSKEREKIVRSGQSILGLLPLNIFERAIVGGEFKWVVSQNLSRIERLKLTHKAINQMMQSIRSNAMCGIDVETLDSIPIRLHCCIAQYVSDIPETKDMLGIKYGHTTTHPCFRCLVPCEELNSHGTYVQRDWRTTKRILDTIENEEIDSPDKKRAKCEMDDHSLHPFRPLFYDFPFVGLIEQLSIYRIFSVEPMHVLHLGISKLIKQTTCNRLKSTELTSSAISTTTKTFSYIRKSILRQLNSFLDSVSTNTDGIRVFGNLRSGGGKSGLNGLYKEDGISGMIEATTIQKIDNVSPFMGALIDRACGEEKECPLTKIYTQYKNIADKVVGNRSASKRWKPEELRDLETQIASLKELSVRVLGPHQASNMGTIKWHLLSHISEDIKMYGSLNVGNANVYEESHKIFKSNFKKTNMRSSTAYDNSLSHVSDEVLERGIQEKLNSGEADEANRMNASQKRAISEKQGQVVRPWCDIKLYDLKVAFSSLHRSRSICAPQYNNRQELFEYMKSIGCTAAGRLVACIEELLSEKNVSRAEKEMINVEISRSMYIPSCPAPSMSDMTGDNSVIVVDKSSRITVKRVHSTRKYYGSILGRFDTVMIRNQIIPRTNTRSESVNSENASTSTGDKNNSEVWFGKCLSIVTIRNKALVEKASNICFLHNKVKCERCNVKSLGSYVFVQYYDVAGNDDIEIDEVEKELGCIRLKWSREHEEQNDGLDRGKVYGLCPIESLLGPVQVVPGAETIRLLDKEKVSFRRKVEERCGPIDRWEGEYYYVNNYYNE